jgi:hypothetical protein
MDKYSSAKPRCLDEYPEIVDTDYLRECLGRQASAARHLAGECRPGLSNTLIEHYLGHAHSTVAPKPAALQEPSLPAGSDELSS